MRLAPVLYLRGISTGDFQDALTALLGADAPNLSPGAITRLTAGWQDDDDRWQRRDLSVRRYVCIWADGVYLQARMEPQAECRRSIIGATPEGRKELVGFQVGLRESTRDAGGNCWSTSRPAACPCRHSWPLAMEHLGSGRPSTRPFPRPGISAAGFTRCRMFSISFRSPCSLPSTPICATYPMPKPVPRPWRRSKPSARNTASNTNAASPA